MNILVINSGSSSIKIDGINSLTSERWMEVQVERLLDEKPLIQLGNGETRACSGPGHETALKEVFPIITERWLDGRLLHGIGHRVVHGGEAFSDPTIITDEVIDQIDALEHLAPLHNPVNLIGIQAARQYWPDLPHVAVFDTAFHQTLPHRAQFYAIPKVLTEKYNIRRYGFHGTSHRYVARMAAEWLDTDLRQLRMITCHLGNGASACAVEYGRSIETSMGMTPLEGLVMGTRSGDVDPGVIFWLMKQEGWTIAQADDALNKQSGLIGLAHVNDMRDIEARAAEGDEDARMAIQIYAHRVRKYIGAYAAVMGGVDAIVFTGGIGENSSVMRGRIAQRLDFLGAVLDEDANRDADLDASEKIAEISTSNSRCKLLVIPTDEEGEIARQTSALLAQKHQVEKGTRTIPIAISARHVHLTQEVVEQLFGEGHELQVHKWLSQPGQFAAREQVTLIGPKNSLERVRILGPIRSKCQVEISRTDEFYLGIDAPVRASGHTENSPGITLQGPKGTVTLKEGVICAWRHIHMTPDDAQHFGVDDKDVVEVHIENTERSLTFGNVLIRVSPNYKLEMHIDTDEGNAAELNQLDEGELILTVGQAQLMKRKVR